jgi:hypothetical protein
MQQTTALYDFYKNRSYSSTVKTLGNVMIQPTMYFVLRHMPMFNGTYIIRNVKHSISSGSFNTEFNGQRVSVNINTKVSDDLASVNEDFSKKLSDKVKQFVSSNTLVPFNKNTKQYLTNAADANAFVLSEKIPYQGFIVKTTDSKTQDCSETISPIYGAIQPSDLITSSITVSNLATLISGSTTNTNLRTYMFCMLYMMGNDTETIRFQYKQNNLYGVIVDVAFPGDLKSKITKYRCLETGEKFTRPFATFDNIQDNINFVRDYYSKQMDEYFKAGLSKQDTINAIIELFYKTWYTSGSLKTEYNDKNGPYDTWIGVVGRAYIKAKTLGLY